MSVDVPGALVGKVWGEVRQTTWRDKKVRFFKGGAGPDAGDPGRPDGIAAGFPGGRVEANPGGGSQWDCRVFQSMKYACKKDLKVQGLRENWRPHVRLA